jgi:glycogen operon protein
VNFITCHDGFTLCDLVSYNGKHNEANGESNADGSNDNYSSNYGYEGYTDDADINRLRLRMMKNVFCILMLNRGVPMILMGDEVARTQFGNNNAYCQDNRISWLDWSLLDDHPELFRFASEMIKFRHKHPVLREASFFRHQDWKGTGKRDISFHGTQASIPDFSTGSRCLAFLLCGKHSPLIDNDIYVAMNMYWEPLRFQIPRFSDSDRWKVVVNTSMPAPEDIFDDEHAPELGDNREIIVGGRSIIVMVTDRE